MDLVEAMQAQVEGGQIKFLFNDGPLLQLDNHIITDADGNQILVQDPEQIQQLLQNVALLQPGDGLDGAKHAGETLQMMTDANGQNLLVHGKNNEAQLIDVSLLNAEGQLIIQQGHDGELDECAHVIGEDGTRIPVSVSYTADGQPIVQVHNQQLVAAVNEHHEQQLQQQQPQQQHVDKGLDVENATGVVDVNDGNNGDEANSASGAFMALEAHDVNGGDSTGASSSVSFVSIPSLDDDHNVEAEEQQANAADAALAAAAAAQENAYGVNENEQQQQQAFTHKLDELAAAAEGSTELAESGIHQVAAAAGVAAAVEAEQQHQQQFQEQQHELEQQHQQQLHLKSEVEFGDHQVDVEGGGN